jgi:hypothetical protein
LKIKTNSLLPIVLAVILPGISFLTDSGLLFLNNRGIFLNWFSVSLLIYLLWYFLWYLWDIKSLYKKWWYLSGMTVLFGIILTVFLLRYQTSDDFEWQSLARFIIGIILFITVQFALKIQYRISRLQLEKEQMQTENYKAQLKVLQAQIDPHFLFNALNTLRSMVRHQDSNSEQFVMSLADFYRHALNHYKEGTIQLAEELDVLKSYLFLMKSRNQDAVLVDLDIEEHLFEHHLPTMALQIVVENCFKHNSMSSTKPLSIDISNVGELYIEVCNNLQPKIVEVESTGHGLEILNEKYKLLKIQDGLIIEKSSNEFCVKLKLIQP